MVVGITPALASTCHGLQDLLPVICIVPSLVSHRGHPKIGSGPLGQPFSKFQIGQCHLGSLSNMQILEIRIQESWERDSPFFLLH